MLSQVGSLDASVAREHRRMMADAWWEKPMELESHTLKDVTFGVLGYLF